MMPFITMAQTTNNEKLILIGMSVMAGLNIPFNYVFFILYGLIGIAYSTLAIYSIGGIIIIMLSYFVMKKQGYIV
jgi:Na+-driven multidrug efflux pump